MSDLVAVQRVTIIVDALLEEMITRQLGKLVRRDTRSSIAAGAANTRSYRTCSRFRRGSGSRRSSSRRWRKRS